MPCLVRAFYATHCADLSDDGLVAVEERIEKPTTTGGLFSDLLTRIPSAMSRHLCTGFEVLFDPADERLGVPQIGAFARRRQIRCLHLCPPPSDAGTCPACGSARACWATPSCTISPSPTSTVMPSMPRSRSPTGRK